MTASVKRGRARLAWASLLLVGAAWALGEGVGERTLPTLLLAYAPSMLWLLPALLALLWAVIRRRGVAVALAATLLAAWGAGLLHFRPQRGGDLRVLSYNVLGGQRTTPERLAAVLRASGADIILLQEARFQSPGFQEALLADLPGYRAVSAREVTTLTRLPVRATQRLPLSRLYREVLVTRLDWRGRPLTVVNAHLGTVQVSGALSDPAYLRRTVAARGQQAGVLRGLAATTAGTLILGGDLNTPPRGPVYRQLRQAFGPDAHDLAGRGPGWTFPRLALRIDHLLARGLTPTQAQVWRVAGSDHRPLLVDYVLP